MQTRTRLNPRAMLLVSFLSLFFLGACHDGRPKELNVTQHGLYLTLVRESETGRLYVDEKNSTCYSRGYRYSIDYSGPAGEGWKMNPLETCHKMVGYLPATYVDVVNFQEEVRLLIKENYEED